MKEKAKQLRKDILQVSFDAGACHIGSALSCVELMIDIFYKRMKKEDRFIFSKASGAVTLYIILADLGYFPKEKLPFYLKNYPESSKEVPGVLHSVGSVGHGLAVAVGLAYADRERDVYCVISDGECQEGTTFESALFARQHKLINLFVICDDNKIQANGPTKDIIDLETAFEFFQKTFPHFERIETVKGAGVDFMANDYNWHYRNLTPELLAQALKQI